MTEISIIVPCRNEAGNVVDLTDRVRAVANSRQLEVELILVDDGSTDHTGKLIDELAAHFDFVRALHHQRSLGITAAWQTGLEASLIRYALGDLATVTETTWSSMCTSSTTSRWGERASTITVSPI